VKGDGKEEEKRGRDAIVRKRVKAAQREKKKRKRAGV